MTIYLLIKIDLATGKRLETYDDEHTEAQLDAYFSNALEVGRDRDGGLAYRFADGWYSYISEEV